MTVVTLTGMSQTADTLRWAMVNIPVACMRAEQANASELISQAIMGTPMKVHGSGDGYYYVETPEGYKGYMTSSSLVEKTGGQMGLWRQSPRLVVTSLGMTNVYRVADPHGPRDVLVRDVVNGTILEGSLKKGKGKMVEVILPDGRHGYVSRKDVTTVEKWAEREFDPQLILDVAYSMLGTPYLWGGCSTKALDCSGLVKVSYLANGLILMRDASQQARTGGVAGPLPSSGLQAGDLLFFGNPEKGRVTHVAIYDRDNRYIHSSGCVKVSEMDESDPDFSVRSYLSSTRIKGHEGEPGIVRASKHPWYF